MPPRRRRYKRNNKKNVPRKRSDAVVKKLAKQAMSSMKPMKMFINDGINQAPSLASNPWFCILPYDIPGSSAAGSSGDVNRNSDQTWIHRCSGILEAQFSNLTINPVEVRKMCGWYKGSAKPNDVANSAFGVAHLGTSFPTRLTRYDSDNWKIIEDKNFTVMPHQIYDSAAGNAGTAALRANWKPLTLKCNFNLNKVVRYTDGTDAGAGITVKDGGLQQNGAYHVGWIPFIGIQLRCPTQAFTDYQGSNPSPTLDYKFTTYFKDNM